MPSATNLRNWKVHLTNGRTNRKNIVFQHGNARPYTSLSMRQKLFEFSSEVLPHPPYSSNLTPSFRYSAESSNVSLWTELQMWIKFAGIQIIHWNMGIWKIMVIALPIDETALVTTIFVSSSMIIPFIEPWMFRFISNVSVIRIR